MDLNLAVVTVLLVLSNRAATGLAPPTRPPAELEEAYTVGGRVPLEFYYVDDSNQGNGTHYQYSLEDITALISQAEEFISEHQTSPSTPPPPPPASLPVPPARLSLLSDVWLVHALTTHPVQGKDVAIFGSMLPWYESIVLAMGAATVTVIEYNRLTYAHPRITTLLLSALELQPQFDAVLSLSSFDHDGLGRYGDPLNPDGDLVAMETVSKVLKDTGLFFLTVPIGSDVIVWNLHRRYGNIRLPMLLAGWEVVERIGWGEGLLTSHTHFTTAYEPVFVLSKRTRQVERTEL